MVKAEISTVIDGCRAVILSAAYAVIFLGFLWKKKFKKFQCGLGNTKSNQKSVK